MIEAILDLRDLKNGIIQNYVVEKPVEIMLSFIAANAKLEPHQHEEPQFGISIKKSFDFYITDRYYNLAEMDGYLLKSNSKHAARNLDSKECIAIDIKYYDKKDSLQEDRLLKFEKEYEDNWIIIKHLQIRKDCFYSLDADFLINIGATEHYITHTDGSEQLIKAFQIYKVTDLTVIKNIDDEVLSLLTFYVKREINC